MKKNVRSLLTGVMVLTMVVAITPTIAFADEATRGSYFMDADNDGVCDNQAFGNRGVGHKQNKCQAVNFTDTNGDGVCDNRASGEGRKCYRGRNR